MVPFYDLPPASHPLLTPEPEFSYTNFASHPSIPPYMLPMDDCWYNQLQFY
ncbi:hypothetical protein BY458DRAFT_427902 [Sporodiniella umbellata]|nr:hypothetical protein BY458DRAFT_427902 [Sporodiniella umbellata]